MKYEQVSTSMTGMQQTYLLYILLSATATLAVFLFMVMITKTWMELRAVREALVTYKIEFAKLKMVVKTLVHEVARLRNK